ncbi:MAG: DUF6279 family lipoprotein [Pseudomonadota bacterium]
MRAVLVLLLVLLQACSPTRFVYDNADTFLRWQANSYFDFHDEQADDLDRRIAAFLAWHRAEALPQYARFAEEAAGRLLRGLQRADLEWGYDTFLAHVRGALGAAGARMADLLDRLSAEQLAHLEQRLADENRKFAREQLQGTVEERRQRRLKRNLERLEEWFGPLSDAQAGRVRAYSERAPLGGELRERDRRRRQKEFVEMLRAREARKRLSAWASAWDGGREPAYQKAARETREAYFDLLLDLDRMLAPGQRAAAAARMREYAASFGALSRR